MLKPKTQHKKTKLPLAITKAENVGKLQDIHPDKPVNLGKLSLLHGENGTGKTTFSAIFHSVGVNSPATLLGRCKLGADSAVGVELIRNNTEKVTFSNGEWSKIIPNIAVFGDQYIAENVYAGLEVTEQHQHNHFEVLLGKRAIKLNQQLATCIAEREKLVDELFEFDSNIPMSVRRGFSVEEFVKIPTEVDQSKIDSDAVRAIESFQLKESDIGLLTSQLIQHDVVRNRNDPTYSAFCEEYLGIKNEILSIEQRIKQIRGKILALKQHVISKYFEKINAILRVVSADFKIVEVKGDDPTMANLIDYKLRIDKHDIPIVANDAKPQFKNTMSAGDRTTLALAFFLAKLEIDGELDKKIIVFDDPIASMDTNRVHFLEKVIARLANEADSVIVLSHSMQFLLGVYRVCREIKHKVAFEILRADKSQSVIRKWNIKRDLIPDFNRRLNRIKRYYKNCRSEDKEQVAYDFRLVLEGYCQVHYGMEITYSKPLGSFLSALKEGTNKLPVLFSDDDIELLGDLIYFANPFHHSDRDTINGVQISDKELTENVRKLLKFMNFLERSENAERV